MQEVVGAGVLGEVRDHRADDRQVVDAAGDVREQVADRDAALAVAAGTSRATSSTLPTLLNWVGCVFTLIGWPCSRSSRGLGSNVSTCDGPPSMNRKMTFLALRREVRRPRRQRVAAASRRASAPRRRPARPAAPPAPARRSRWRSAAASRGGSAGGRGSVGSASGDPPASSVHVDEFFDVDQDMAEVRPGARVVGPPYGPRGLGEEREPVGGLLARRRAAEGRDDRAARAGLRRSAGLARSSASRRSAQSRAWSTTNGSFSRVRACAGTFETFRRPIVENGDGEVEGEEHRVEEVAADVEVEAAPAVAVERARASPAGPGRP